MPVQRSQNLDAPDRLEPYKRSISRRRTPEPPESTESTEPTDIAHVYHYEPLDDPTEQIRLLTFSESQEADDSIHCVLHTFQLASLPQYAAVSYAWGTDAITKDISINGDNLSVRANCWRALSQVKAHRRTLADFRHSRRLPGAILDHIPSMDSVIKYFWIDSICIDQQNLSEKSHQVQIMSKIFSEARCVLASIGSHEGDSEFLLEFMRRLTVSGTWLGKWIYKAQESVPLNKPDGLSPLEYLNAITRGRLESAVVAWADRPYWSRLWIVPELHVAASLQYLCGEYMLEWKALRKLGEGLESFFIEDSTFSHYWRASPMVRVLQDHQQRQQSMPMWYWATLWSDYCTWKCSDPRDRIFAFLSFVDWKPVPLLKPDYTRSCVDIWLDLVKLFSGENQPLEYYFETMWLNASTALTALDIDATDPEIRRLVAARRSHTNVAQTLGPDAEPQMAGQTQGKIKAKIFTNNVVRVSQDQDGNITARFRSFATEVSTESSIVSADNHRLVRESNGLTTLLPIAGHICSDARHGDLLLSLCTQGNFVGVNRDVCLVIRQCEDSLYEIIGQAVIDSPYNLTTSALYPEGYCEGEIYFDQSDLLAFIGQDEISPIQQRQLYDRLCFHRIAARICGSRFSSYVRIDSYCERQELDSASIAEVDADEGCLAVLEQHRFAYVGGQLLAEGELGWSGSDIVDLQHAVIGRIDSGYDGNAREAKDQNDQRIDQLGHDID